MRMGGRVRLQDLGSTNGEVRYVCEFVGNVERQCMMGENVRKCGT